jgi:hypothetical protein
MQKITDLVSEVDVHWTTGRLDDQTWTSLKAAGQPVEGKEREATLGPVLIGERVFFAHIEEENEATSWGLHSKVRPASEPPKTVTERTERLGGAEGLLRFLLADQKTEGVGTAEFRLRITLPGSRWECVAIPFAPLAHDPVTRLDPKAAVEQIGYRFVERPIGIGEVTLTYMHETDEYRVFCVAKGTMAPSADVSFPYVDDVVQLIVGTFFRSRDGKSTG